MYSEYREKDGQKWFEGTFDEQPTIDEVKEIAIKENKEIKDVDVYFDAFQEIWRFNIDVK